MSYACLAILLFGFVHAGSKLILETGIALLPFCLLYSGIRLLAQLPVVIAKGSYWAHSRMHFFLLALLGLIGAFLQLAEFKGISEGLPVNVVTFLLYSYPVWSLVLSVVVNKESLTIESLVKVILSVAGIFLILGSQMQDFKFDRTLLYPLGASVLMALWVSLSNLAKKKGLSTWSISFYYDLFSFLVLLLLTISKTNSAEMTHLQHWLSNSTNAIYIVLYSVLFGVIPNLLFYQASQKLSALTLSLLLMLEPVISSSLSSVIWSEKMSETFLFGAVLILVSQISVKYFLKKDRLCFIKFST
jgi:drug/metabolite transporter (DMT)-like permease